MLPVVAHFPGGKFRYFCQKCVSSPFFTLHCCIRTAGTEGSNYHLPAPNSFNSRGEVSPGDTVHNVHMYCICVRASWSGKTKPFHFNLSLDIRHCQRSLFVSFFSLSSTDVRIFGQFLLSHYVVQFNLRKCDQYKSWPCFLPMLSHVKLFPRI